MSATLTVYVVEPGYKVSDFEVVSVTPSELKHVEHEVTDDKFVQKGTKFWVSPAMLADFEQQAEEQGISFEIVEETA